MQYMLLQATVTIIYALHCDWLFWPVSMLYTQWLIIVTNIYTVHSVTDHYDRYPDSSMLLLVIVTSIHAVHAITDHWENYSCCTHEQVTDHIRAVFTVTGHCDEFHCSARYDWWLELVSKPYMLSQVSGLVHAIAYIRFDCLNITTFYQVFF